MSRSGLSIFILAATLSIALVTPPGAYPREDTAYIVFERAGVSEHHADPYIVKKNEHLFEIIRGNYNVSEKDIHRILQLIKRLNPDMKDINVIHPGQRLLLPRKKSSGAGASSPAGDHSPLPVAVKKTDAVFKYRVKSGDSISEIIHEFGNKYGEIYRILEVVKRLNPKIKNFNNIYPGQLIRFPQEARKETALSAEDGGVFVPAYQIVPVVSHILKRMQDTVLTEGSYCIPIPPSSEVTVDCSKVPVIETRGGNTIFFDVSGRIPPDLRRVIESTWKTYRVVGVGEGGEAISSLLGRILRAAGVYTLDRVGRQIKIGDTPIVRVFTDWIVSKRTEAGKPVRYALNFLRERSDLLPLPVKIYAQKNGFEIIEIMNGSGIEGDETVYQAFPLQVLDPGSGLACADSLLKILGYFPAEEVEIALLSGDGLSFSMKAEFLLNLENYRVIVTSQGISEPVLRVLRERGDRVIFVPDERGRTEIVEDILRAVDIPFSREDFRFSLSQRTGEKRGGISLPALRLGGERNLYLVDYNVDKYIQELLRQEWKVKLVRY